MNILVVEDEQFARKAMVKKLSANNSQDIILEAENGVKALACLDEYDVDVLITDVKMPKMNGIELLSAIEDEHIQKVILSGYAEFEYAKKAIAYGVKSYLLKPLDYTELIDVVEGLRGSYYEARIKHSFLGNNSEAMIDRSLTEEGAGGILAVLLDNSVEKTAINGIDNLVERHLQRLHNSEVSVLGFSNPYKKNERIFFIRGCGDELQLSSCVGILASVLSKHQFMAVTHLSDMEKGVGRCYETCRRKLLRRFFTKEHFFSDAFTDQASIRLNHIKQKIDYFMDQLYSGHDTARKRLFLEETFASAGNVVDFEKAYFYFFDRMMDREEGVGNWHLARSLHDFDSIKMLLDYLESIGTASEMIENDMGIVHKIKGYIERHYDEDMSLNELAEKVYYVNPNYLSRKFKESFGISFKKYLLKVRMEKSRFLLQQGDLSVGDVAGRVGYNSSSYFIKTYKAFYGHTPKSEK